MKVQGRAAFGFEAVGVYFRHYWGERKGILDDRLPSHEKKGPSYRIDHISTTEVQVTAIRLIEVALAPANFHSKGGSLSGQLAFCVLVVRVDYVVQLRGPLLKLHC